MEIKKSLKSQQKILIDIEESFLKYFFRANVSNPYQIFHTIKLANFQNNKNKFFTLVNVYTKHVSCNKYSF